MKNVARPASLLTTFVLVMLAGNLAGQEEAPKSAKPDDEPQVISRDALSAKLLKVGPNDDELRLLMRQRYELADREVKILVVQYQMGRVANNELFEAEKRWLQAGLELCNTSADRIALLRQYIVDARTACDIAEALRETDLVRGSSVLRARYELTDAMIQLQRAVREAERAKVR